MILGKLRTESRKCSTPRRASSPGCACSKLPVPAHLGDYSGEVTVVVGETATSWKLAVCAMCFFHGLETGKTSKFMWQMLPPELRNMRETEYHPAGITNYFPKPVENPLFDPEMQAQLMAAADEGSIFKRPLSAEE